MTWEDWTQIVAKLNARWPDQPINAATAAEWWTELQAFSAGDVWLAIRTHHRTGRGTFRPQLADILDGIDTHDREMAEQRRAQQSATRQLQARRGGRAAPPEFLESLKIHREASRPGAKVEDRAEATAMIDTLAGQLEDRAATRPESVMDATRTCPGCAASPVAGYVAGPSDEDARGVPVATLVPCPDCQSTRRAAWDAGTLHTRIKEKTP